MTLLDIWAALREHAGFLRVGVAAAFAAILAVVWLLPEWYTATAILMPPQQPASTAALLSNLNPLGGLATRDLGLKNPADIYVGLLGSRSIADEIIARFGLRTVYRERTLVEARAELARHTTVVAGKDTLIRISVEDRDPKRAAGIVNAYLDELQKQGSRLAITEAAQRRLFFEQQLEAEKQMLAAAEAELKTTQEETGLVQVSSQAEAAIRAIAQLRAQVTAREVHLKSLRTAATDENPEVVRQETELRALRAEQRRAEQNPDSVLMPPHRLPSAGLEYVRTLRELKYREAVMELLLKQYQAARFDEAKAAPALQVVDYAVPPDKKSWPPRALLTLLATLLASLILGFGVITRQAWRGFRGADVSRYRTVYARERV